MTARSADDLKLAPDFFESGGSLSVEGSHGPDLYRDEIGGSCAPGLPPRSPRSTAHGVIAGQEAKRVQSHKSAPRSPAISGRERLLLPISGADTGGSLNMA